MRFDLLDEYSTLVPFGLGSSKKMASQDPAGPAKVAKHGTVANFASRLELLGKRLGALRQMLFGSSGAGVPAADKL